MRRVTLVVAMFGLLAAVGATEVAAAEDDGSSGCTVANAAGPALAAPVNRRSPAQRRMVAKKVRKTLKALKKLKVSLQADPQSANRSVNLGSDREAEEIPLRVNASRTLPKNFAKLLDIAAEPFISTSETGDTVTFSEPTFSELKLSGNGKRITFKMCLNPPNNLPAGKYVSTVMLEGPPPVEGAVMTVTLNAKDGGGFIIAAIVTAAIAFLVLLYKGAGEKRAASIARAPKAPEAERKQAEKEAEEWGKAIKQCLSDLGWLVPTVASILSAFALLYAAYANNPAWGEGGLVASAIALVGTGLAAVGVRTVFTQTPTGDQWPAAPSP
jgi:hypothetical protein